MVGMNALDHFLREHSSVHRAAVVRTEFNMDYLLEGLTDRQLRLRPHSLNSLAWIFWHVARTEDGFVSCIVLQRDQLFDQENWSKKLGVPTRDTSTEKEAVAELSEGIDLDALWAYRDSVGRRTREGVVSLWPDRWNAPIEIADVGRAVAAGFGSPHMEHYISGKPRESALYWWGLHHTLMHLGQVAMLRGLVGEM